MDITKELKQFNSDGYELLSKQLSEEKENIRKKNYIFTILNIAKTLEEELENGSFEGLKSVSLRQTYDEDLGDTFDDITFVDSSNNKIENDDNEAYQIIEELLGRYYFCLEEELYPNKISNQTITINFEKPIKNQIIELFLIKELKSIVNYAELSLTMKDSDNNNKVKVKV